VVDRPAPQQLQAHGLKPLQYAQADARDLAAALEYLGVPAASITTLRNAAATTSGIREELRRLARKAAAPDTLLVFFLGHGVADAAGNSQLIAHDRPLPVKELLELLGEIPAERLFLIMDACASGQPGRPQFLDEWPTLSRSRGGLAWLSSARPGQAAYEASELGHGVFSDQLIRVLRHSARHDSNRDGKLDWNEIGESVQAEVKAWTRGLHHDQEPQFGTTHWTGVPTLLNVRNEWSVRVLNADRQARVEVRFPPHELARNEALWLLVAPRQDDWYWPQHHAVMRAKDGPVSQQMVYLGEEHVGQGETFRILLIRADPALGQRLSVAQQIRRNLVGDPFRDEELLKAEVEVTRPR
jgi:hypothetical protein